MSSLFPVTEEEYKIDLTIFSCLIVLGIIALSLLLWETPCHTKAIKSISKHWPRCDARRDISLVMTIYRRWPAWHRCPQAGCSSPPAPWDRAAGRSSHWDHQPAWPSSASSAWPAGRAQPASLMNTRGMISWDPASKSQPQNSFVSVTHWRLRLYKGLKPQTQHSHHLFLIQINQALSTSGWICPLFISLI